MSTPRSVSSIPPRPRRWDHVSAACVGICLLPVLLALAARSFLFIDDAEPVGALAMVGCATLMVVMCAHFFARRSSLGFLVSGVSAALIGCSSLLAPTVTWRMGHASALPHVLDAGFAWMSAMVFLGGSWAMRRARRSGREAIVHSRTLAAQDQLVGHVPEPSPSRRPAHIASGAISAVCTVGGVPLLVMSYTQVATDHGSLVSVVGWLGACVAVLAASAVGAHSSLGPRLVGSIVWVSAVVALAVSYVSDVHVPHPILVAMYGAMLLAVGWGAHWARVAGSREQRRHAAMSA